MPVAIEAQELSKQYQLGQFQAGYETLRETMTRAAKSLARRERRHREREEIWALRDVSFHVSEGEVLGIIGANGAGKSTLLKILTRITTPTSGRAEIRGRVGSLLEVGTGFHPELTGRENIYLNGSILGMKRREITRKFADIVDFSGIEKFIDTPVKRYSSGMYVRLAFAVAAHLEPEVLLIDEVLAVGDAEFQRRSLGRMEELSGAGRTVLFVSHNMQAVSQLCDRVILLERGRAVQEGPAADVVASYLQRAAGAGASRAWPDDETAPGDQIVRLRSARVVDAHLQVSNSVDVRESVGIEIGFSVLRAGEPVFPKIKLRTARGETAFNAIDTSPRWRESTPPGEYVSTAWLPANFLNEGLHYVDVHVCSAGMTKLYPHAGSANALSFHVYDPSEGDSARGPFLGQWKGVVRPLLEWTTEER